MSDLTRRILLLSCRLFQRLDEPSRTWLISRLQADHADLIESERLQRKYFKSEFDARGRRQDS